MVICPDPAAPAVAVSASAVGMTGVAFVVTVRVEVAVAVRARRGARVRVGGALRQAAVGERNAVATVVGPPLDDERGATFWPPAPATVTLVSVFVDSVMVGRRG